LDKRTAAVRAKHDKREDARANEKEYVGGQHDRKRITFRRSMHLQGGDVKWKRMTAIVGRGGATNRQEKNLRLNFKKAARGKKKLGRREATKFFERLNKVTPPFDALEYLDIDTEGITMVNIRNKVDDYNACRAARKSELGRIHTDFAQSWMQRKRWAVPRRASRKHSRTVSSFLGTSERSLPTTASTSGAPGTPAAIASVESTVCDRRRR
jgi:hypothetical protein